MQISKIFAKTHHCLKMYALNVQGLNSDSSQPLKYLRYKLKINQLWIEISLFKPDALVFHSCVWAVNNLQLWFGPIACECCSEDRAFFNTFSRDLSFWTWCLILNWYTRALHSLLGLLFSSHNISTSIRTFSTTEAKFRTEFSAIFEALRCELWKMPEDSGRNLVIKIDVYWQELDIEWAYHDLIGFELLQSHRHWLVSHLLVRNHRDRLDLPYRLGLNPYPIFHR